MKPKKMIEPAALVHTDPSWVFRVIGADERRATTTGKTWHEARAKAAAELHVEPGELALVEGGR